MQYRIPLHFYLLCIIFSFFSCQTNYSKKEEVITPSLKNEYRNDFYIGVAISEDHILERDTAASHLVKTEFNSLTPENAMKWEYIHPAPDSFYFDIADQYIELGADADMHIVGHPLIWHSQLPDWVGEIKDSATMSRAFKKHISTIVERYKGSVDAWEVINEGLNDNGKLRESIFYNVMGAAYLVQAFQFAAEADSTADLIYNDYNLWIPSKRIGAVYLIKYLQSVGVKIDGVGMQGHLTMNVPSIEDIENSIIAFSELGVKVAFTELDITMLINPWDASFAEMSQDDEKKNPYSNGLPDSLQHQLAERYEAIFNLFLKHKDKISRVTFWGVNDEHSWLNNWPIAGRTNYPLLFDRNYKPKPAYEAILKLKEK